MNKLSFSLVDSQGITIFTTKLICVCLVLIRLAAAMISTLWGVVAIWWQLGPETLSALVQIDYSSWGIDLVCSRCSQLNWWPHGRSWVLLSQVPLLCAVLGGLCWAETLCAVCESPAGGHIQLG